MTVRKNNILIYLLVITFLTSCAVIKVPRRHKLKKLDVEKIYSEVKANEVNYNTYSIKYSAKINMNGNKNSVNGVLRIKKDSAIWISVSPGFGVEVMRLLATPDSVKMINRLNSTYFAGDYRYLNKIFNFQLDYYSLQAILTNSFFSYNSSKAKNSIKNFTSKIDSNNYLLQSLPANLETVTAAVKPDIIQQILVTPEAYKIFKILLIDYLQNRTFQINFSNYIVVNENKFPQNLNFIFNTSKSKSEINIKYTNIVVNKQLRMPFKISKKYKQIK